MEHSAIRRNNARLVGNGDKLIVFAHGFGTNQRAFRHQEAALSDEFRLLFFDHVGAGRSDPEAYSPHRYQSLRSYAEDLLELLAELDVSDAYYVGHSMSGMIGLLAAIEEPERFRKLMLLGASPRYLNDGAYRGGFEQADIDGLYEAMSANYHAWVSGFAPLAMGNPDRPELARHFAETLSEIRPDIALAVARIIFQSDHRADLGNLKVPTLVVQSRSDAAVPMSVGEYLTSHIPNAELLVLDATGHLPHLSAPDAVTAAIRSFAR